MGGVATDPAVVHVDCTALGLRKAPATPIFEPDRIVIQEVRHNSPTFNAALIGWVEAHRDDAAEKNRLCPPNPYASGIEDWPRMMTRTWTTERQWLSARAKMSNRRSSGRRRWTARADEEPASCTTSLPKNALLASGYPKEDA